MRVPPYPPSKAYQLKAGSQTISPYPTRQLANHNRAPNPAMVRLSRWVGEIDARYIQG